MCYYNRLIVPESRAFTIGDITLSLPEHMISAYVLQSGFEYGSWPIIKVAESGTPEVVKAHWEFLAPWVKTWKDVEASRQKYTTLNAVGENILNSNLYKDAAMSRRCLVPSSGFYEWRHIKPEGAKKDLAIPYFISIPAQPVFYMGGLWQNWTDRQTGEFLTSFAIVTAPANDLMSRVHNKKKRMPLILPDPLALEWLNPSLPREQVQQLACYQLESNLLQAYTIQKDFRTQVDPILPCELEGIPAL